MRTRHARGRQLDRGVVTALIRRPYLWNEAIRSSFAMAGRGWWRTVPFLPVPDPVYLQWRAHTAYGSSEVDPSVHDVVAYLEWRRSFRRAVS